MLKAYQFRIYPNKLQKELFAKHFGCVRHVYNWALEAKQKHYKETGLSLSKRALQDQLVLLKKTDKPWLAEVNSQSLLASLLHLDNAFQNFFQKRAKFPKFKKKYSGWQSFQCPQHVTVNFETGLLNLPKIKGIKAMFHRQFAGKIKTATVKKTPTDQYQISILVEDNHVLPIPTVVEADKTMGLDLGLTHYLIDSGGNKVAHPSHLKNGIAQLNALQKQFSRCKENSSNRKKQKLRVARQHAQISNRRDDFIHQLSASLAYKNQETSFAVEDLHVKGMIRNRKLSSAIADSSWASFITKLTYKCVWVGKNILPVSRFAPSSKVCNVCLTKRDKMPLSLRKWQCICGAMHDRDINAARTIKTFALADALGHSVCVKQSPCNDSFQRSYYSERSCAR